MEPREWALDRRFRALAGELPLTLHADGGDGGHFLIPRADFARWARGRAHLRMDQFYPTMRKRFGLLLTDDGGPEGGKWSFDAENRAHARGVAAPEIPGSPPPTPSPRRCCAGSSASGAGGRRAPSAGP
ncbi:MAG: cryptochrome/photolyase family protein [Deltaproteobacteria bacterium]|nr:cryptochrome/photolyase family protein [Deltaproteobacteria bacterium]